MDHRQAPRSAYIHIPFCVRRCGYCNFAVVADRADLVPAYLDALSRELKQIDGRQQLDTLFLGGGTPTQLSAPQLRSLLQMTAEQFDLADDYEFSVESNPGELDEARADMLAAAGVTRISLGAQSFDEGKLIGLERTHNRSDVERSFKCAANTGAQVSIDLMFAAPRERLATWRHDLEAAIRLSPDHVSTYGLTIERGTQFWNRQNRGVLTQVDDETQRAMYELAIELLTSAGFEHYEVSNFAKPGARCRHNQVYWQGGSYYGLGPGAASHMDGKRRLNHRSTSTYIKRMRNGRSPIEMEEELSASERARERLVFSLRMLEGVDEPQFKQESGFDIESLAGPAIAEFVAHDLLAREHGRLKLTHRGLLVSDSLWPALLAPIN